MTANMIYGWLLCTACFIEGTLFLELCLMTACQLPASWLETDCQLPARLKNDCQCGLWLAFKHRMFYCRNTVRRQLLGAFPEDCLMTAGQLPVNCLPTAYQLTKDWLPIWFMAGFYTLHVLLQELCESSTSETFDQGLPDNCQPTACRLPANCLPAY